uniref:Uncharacterized protein LOC105125143 n=1 Tax=Rhizophora mucronata TaxID=61149 RepID=A0A2P2M0F2_RHIMU
MQLSRCSASHQLTSTSKRKLSIPWHVIGGSNCCRAASGT